MFAYFLLHNCLHLENSFAPCCFMACINIGKALDDMPMASKVWATQIRDELAL